MSTHINIEKLDPGDREKISIIANWYFDEWNTPIEKTFYRLENQPNVNVLFHLVAAHENKLIATGGLYNTVNLFKIHKRFNRYGPWVALLYTEKNYRNKGFGRLLLEKIEWYAKELNLKEIFLYTFTAESLYRRCGWKQLERVIYKGYDTVIMNKEL